MGYTACNAKFRENRSPSSKVGHSYSTESTGTSKEYIKKGKVIGEF
jgi:hypothetical protein